uniref:G-protein coupled receptors family 1 profile domain-containing protein n=1 Tax=Plectus sambesii TaxID=2011161 RepID=A0A914XSP5_9BILA
MSRPDGRALFFFTALTLMHRSTEGLAAGVVRLSSLRSSPPLPILCPFVAICCCVPPRSSASTSRLSSLNRRLSLRTRTSSIPFQLRTDAHSSFGVFIRSCAMEKRTRANLSDLSHCRLNDTFELNESFMADMSAMGCNCSVLQHFNREEMESLHCGPFPFVHPLLIQIGYVLLFSALILLAVGGNLTVIWIVLRHKRMRTVTNYFLLNLAIADASISVFNLGFSWTFNLYYVWIFGYAYCVFNNFMGIVPTCASVFTMVVMSCDRYVAIVHPLRKRLSKKKTISIIVLIWVLALTCGVPMLLYSKLDKLYFYSEADGSVYVDPICLSDNYPDGKAHTSYLFAVYNNFLVIINYALPLVVLLVAYARVACALWSSETIGDTRHQDSINSKRRVVKMLAAVVFIF